MLGWAMKKIGELLVEQGKVSERDVERTLLAQGEMGEMFGQVLIKLGLVSELDFAQVLSQQLNIPLYAASDYPEEAIKLDGVAEDFLFSNAVVPVRQSEDRVKFAAATPQDPFLSKALTMALEKPVDIVLGLETDISRALQLYLQVDEDGDEDGINDQFAGQSDDEFIEHLKDLASEAPVIRLVLSLIHI